MKEKELLKEYTNWLVDNFNVPSTVWGLYNQRLGVGVSYNLDQTIAKFLDERQKRTDTTRSQRGLVEE